VRAGAPTRRGLRAAAAPRAARVAAALAGAGSASRRVFAQWLGGVLAPSPRLRRRLLVLAPVALCVLLVAGYRFWLRDSSLVSVDRVSVTGLTTEDADRLRAALVSTARTMTTLHVDRRRLEDATAGYPAVRRLEVSTDFPRAMRIRVVEHEPAALAVGAGGRVPVAVDGTVLRGLPVEESLPTVRAGGGLRGDRLADPTAVRAARVAGNAPTPLRRRLVDVSEDGERGFVARLRDGPELIFGTARRLRAKWAAAARVLADADADGASYLDLRVPGRPAAGGVATGTVAAPSAEQAAPDPAAEAATAAYEPPTAQAEPSLEDATGGGAAAPVEP
jgi:cell division protein FtsQ